MRALITGINGFVGGHLAELLVAHAWQVSGIGSGTELGLAALRDQVQFIGLNLLDARTTHDAVAATAPDVIFHLAAQAHVPTALQNPGYTLTNNLIAQLNLFEAVRTLRLDPVIVVSCTSEEYGAVRPQDIPVDEDTPLRPNNPYALSKVTQDMLALQYFLGYGLRTIRLRPFNHIGPRQAPGFVVPDFANQIARIAAGLQAPLLRVGNLQAQRDFTDVRDVVRAYELAALQCEPGEVYNVGSGRPVAIHKLLEMLIELSAVDITIEVDPALVRRVDVPIIACDATRIRARTGWTPEIPLRRSLEDVLTEWRTTVELT